ncbi:MAG: hypothetical protein R8G66_11390 [Cytophagales bacterium]|nr:hypothetical protein [Cytophagales bacterium]
MKMKDPLEREKLAHQNMIYSIQRIDLLIISISGAGIYVCFETIKFLISKNLPPEISVKVAGGLFLIGIIINFISQLTGYETNKFDYLMYLVESESEEELSNDQKVERDRCDKKSEKFSKATYILNYASMGFMFAGLITLMIYFLFIFSVAGSGVKVFLELLMEYNQG